MRESIAQALPGSKSIGSVERGRTSESKVLDYFVKRRFRLLSKNKRIAGVEVDLLFKKRELYLVEVKTLRSFDEAGFRLSRRQLQRLLFVRSWLESLNNQPVILQVAFVVKNEVLLIDVENLPQFF